MNSKQIIVATDFSNHAHYALQRACQMARPLHVTVDCIHVINPLTTYFEWLGITSKQSAIKAQFERAHEFERDIIKPLQVDNPLFFHILEGEIAPTILSYCNEKSPQLLIMGAHGQYYINDYILGTISARVCKKNHLPLLLTKNEAKKPYERILIGTDFSPQSQHAIQFAHQLFPKARFHIYHVADLWYGSDAQATAQKDVHHLEMYQALMNKFKTFIESCSVGAVDYEICGGYPADDLCKKARELDACLVVIGSKQRSIVHELLVGQVGDRLIRMCPTDIMVVPFQSP